MVCLPNLNTVSHPQFKIFEIRPQKKNNLHHSKLKLSTYNIYVGIIFSLNQDKTGQKKPG